MKMNKLVAGVISAALILGSTSVFAEEGKNLPALHAKVYVVVRNDLPEGLCYVFQLNSVFCVYGRSPL